MNQGAGSCTIPIYETYLFLAITMGCVHTEGEAEHTCGVWNYEKDRKLFQVSKTCTIVLKSMPDNSYIEQIMRNFASENVT